MRERKFKAYDKKNHELWDYGKLLVHYSTGDYGYYPDASCVMAGSNTYRGTGSYEMDWIIMEYIGRKDKHGEEIYEDYRVNYEASSPDGQVTIHGTGVIVWDEVHCAYMVLSDNGDWPLIPLYLVTSIEIIGIIHE